MREYKGYKAEDGVIYPSAGDAINADLVHRVNEFLEESSTPELTESQKQGVRDLLAHGDSRAVIYSITGSHFQGMRDAEWPDYEDVEIIA